jgi:hypothetical protein
MGRSFDLSTYNYPDPVRRQHEREDIGKALLPESATWHAPEEAPMAGGPEQKVENGN